MLLTEVVHLCTWGGSGTYWDDHVNPGMVFWVYVTFRNT